MADTWDMMQDWNLVLPPSRPSAAQLSQIVETIRGVDRDNAVAVLGSTPEFRDLLYECGFTNIHVLDRNETFHNAVSAMRVYKNSETFIKGDWLETLPGFRNTFALILSDLTSGNISYDNRAAFYNLIAQSLRVEGLFNDRVLTHPGLNLSIDELLTKYERLPLNLLYANYFSCEMLFCSDLLEINKMVDSSVFYTALMERVKNPRVLAFINYAHK